MGWLLGCFKCMSESQQVKPKKQSSAGVANSVSGRANSAAVAHATSPEDLHRVRKSPSNLAVANSNSYIERGLLESSSSSLLSSQYQAKINEGANLGSKRNEANKLDRERSFRERLVPEADVAKQLGDEVKDSRSCQRVLELPPNSFKVTLNKSEKDRSGQGDFTQHSWLVSSVVTRGGLLFEASSRPSSPFPGLHKHGSLHSRVIQPSQSIDFYDNLGSSSALKCAELNTFRVEAGVSDECVSGNGESLQPTYCKVELKTESAPSKHEVQSPPWTFSEAKLDFANQKNSCIFESSDDLLREHLDISSLIKDSALITNWELSSGELHSEKWGLHDQSPHVPSQGGGKLPHFSGQTKQKHLENGADGDLLDSDSSCSMVIFEVPSDDGTGPFAQPSVGEGDKEFIYAVSNIDYDTKAQLLQAERCTDVEGSDNESGSQSCFSSQFKLSKRLWSSTRKNPFEKDSSMAGYSHDNDNNVNEVFLPCTHPEMQMLQELKNSEDEYQPLLNASTEISETSTDIRVSNNQSLGVHVGNHLQSSTGSFLEPLVRQGSVEVFAFEDETVSIREKDLNVVSFLTEEENREQRKKLKLGQSGSFERMQVNVEDEQVQLLNTVECHESSLEARMDNSNGLKSRASEQLLDESSHEQTSDLSLVSPSLSYGEMPVASYRSPARLADDRPILGTVAAHWSPITTKKWWDGKGIPNSTNKYKEDQKVNWHAIPFEVRLEQALAKQDSVLPK